MNVKPRMHRSAVWDIFVLCERKKKVRCLLCNTSISYNKNTSAMVRHLRMRHPSTIDRYGRIKYAMNYLEESRDVKDEEVIDDEAVINVIAQEMEDNNDSDNDEISSVTYHCYQSDGSCFPKYLNSSYENYHNSSIKPFHTSVNRPMVVPFLLADIGEGIKEVIVKEWFVKEGDKVAEFDNICEVQSDKASVTITSRYNGIVKKIYHEIDDTALVGQPLIDVEVEKEVGSGGTVGAEVQEREAIAVGSPTEGLGDSTTFELPSEKTKVISTPAVRRIAMENKINLSEVEGTGKDGRIMKSDVIAFMEAKRAPLQPRKIEFIPDEPKRLKATIPKHIAHDKKEPIKGYRKGMFKSMSQSLSIPHFGFCDEYNMTTLVSMKNELKVFTEKEELKFSYMPLFLKTASMALQEFPIINSSIDDSGNSIIYKASHNLGFAMDTPEGLVVPNIKGVEHLSILDIMEEMNRLQKLGQRNALSTLDITGGTFTISNIGSIGGTYAKPIILPPEVAIVALGKIQKVPRFDDHGAVIGAHLMNVSFSADHRVIDGATIARFSNLWKSFLEKPSLMMLHLK